MQNTVNINDFMNSYDEWLRTTEVLDRGNVVVNRGIREPMSVEEMFGEDIEAEVADTVDLNLDTLTEDFDSIINESLNTTVSESNIPENIRANPNDITAESEEFWEDIPLEEESLIGDLEAEVDGATELTELLGESSMAEFEEITYLAPDLITASETVAEGAMLTGVSAVAEALGPVALLAVATYALTWAIGDIQKNQAIEEDRRNQIDFINRKSEAQDEADKQGTLDQKNTLMSDFYRQPNTYLYDPEREKYINSTEAIKRVDKYISGFNKHIQHLDNIYSLYNKWVINVSNPDVRNHPYKSMSPIQLNNVIHYKGTTIGLQEKVKQYINDSYTLEGSGIMNIDPLMIDHMREQSYNDPLYEQEKINAFHSGKFKVNTPNELDSMTPPFWSIYYKRNANRFMREDMNKIKMSMKAYKARGGKPIIHRRKHTISPNDRFDIMFSEGNLKSIMRVDNDTAPITNKSNENRKRIKPSKEWILDTKDEEYDPGVAIHNNQLSNKTFETQQSFDHSVFEKYKKKQNLQGNQGFLLYSNSENVITIVFQGTDYPAIEHGHYKKFLKDLFTSLHSNMENYNGDMFHSGYLQKYLLMKPEIENFVNENANEDTNIVFSGFSAGGALAQLSAYSLAKEHKYKNISVYSYASPRVFSEATSKHVDKLIPHNYRINIEHDLVPYFPLKLQGKNSYYHAGTEFLYNKEGNYRRHVGDSDIDHKQNLKDIIKKAIMSWMTHTRSNYEKVLSKHLDTYNQLGKSIKTEIELLKGYDTLFSDTTSFKKINNLVYQSQANDMLYYPSYYKGNITMNAIPKHWIKGIYMYREGEFSNRTGNVLGFALYR